MVEIKNKYREFTYLYPNYPIVKTLYDPKMCRRGRKAYMILMQFCVHGIQPQQFQFGKVNTKKTIKLVSIKRSTKSGKKLMAAFLTNGRQKVIHFGAAGMSDFTKNKDPRRKSFYVRRHSKDLGTGNPSRAGFLSMFVLWNKPSLQASIADYKRRLGIYNKTGKFPTK